MDLLLSAIISSRVAVLVAHTLFDRAHFFSAEELGEGGRLLTAYRAQESDAFCAVDLDKVQQAVNLTAGELIGAAGKVNAAHRAARGERARKTP